jgi:hypothetical protein
MQASGRHAHNLRGSLRPLRPLRLVRTTGPGPARPGLVWSGEGRAGRFAGGSIMPG